MKYCQKIYSGESAGYSRFWVSILESLTVATLEIIFLVTLFPFKLPFRSRFFLFPIDFQLVRTLLRCQREFVKDYDFHYGSR